MRTHEELFIKLLNEFEEAEKMVDSEFSTNKAKSEQARKEKITWYLTEWKRISEVEEGI